MVARDPSYCPACGTSLTTVELEGRVRNYCDACEEPVYRNPKPAAGVLVVDDDSVLLVRRTNPPAGVWSLPAGFLEVDEPPQAAAVRELAEETGLSVSSAALTLFDTAFVDRDNAPTILVVIYAVDRRKTSGEPVAGSDAAAVRSFTDRELVECNALEPGYEGTFRRAIRDFDGWR